MYVRHGIVESLINNYIVAPAHVSAPYLCPAYSITPVIVHRPFQQIFSIRMERAKLLVAYLVARECERAHACLNINKR